MTGGVSRSCDLQVVKLSRHFPEFSLADPSTCLYQKLEHSHLAELDLSGQSIAVAVGSRGITNMPSMLTALGAFLKERGASAFIVPAMGSHGGATAEGQQELLAALGVTRETTGIPVCSSMESTCLGEVQAEGIDWGVHLDRKAAEADGIIVFNRIKAHTDFQATYESGLMKMIAIGLGNADGAQVSHSHGTLGLRCAVPVIAEKILHSGKITAGIAILENANHQTAKVEVLNPIDIPAREPELLQLAKKWMADLPVDQLDGLIIARMGKDISGTGIDTTVVGRRTIMGEPDPPRPRVHLIGVCSLTPASGGNALGVGIADLVSRRLASQVDWEVTTRNVITTTFLERGKLPPVIGSDEEMVRTMDELIRRRNSRTPRMIFIRDTLHLSEFYATEPLVEEWKERNDITPVESSMPIPFSIEGNLELQWEKTEKLSDDGIENTNSMKIVGVLR